MKYLFPVIFLLVFLIFGLELGYTATSPWWTRVTYIFQHANLMHLLVNSVSFFFLFRALESMLRPRRITSTALTAAVAAAFLCVYDKPVVGASGMVYAMVGIYVALVVQYWNGKFRHPKTRYQVTVFLIAVTIALVVSFFKENTAGLLHLVSMVLGFVGQFTIESIYKHLKYKKNERENARAFK